MLVDASDSKSVSARNLTPERAATRSRSKFLRMGAQKPLAVLRLFEEVNAQTVVLMDTDTIWLRDPFPWLDQHPQADMYVTTDCLSHEAEVLKIPNMARCGHVPGSSGPGWAMNTGAATNHAYFLAERLRFWHRLLPQAAHPVGSGH